MPVRPIPDYPNYSVTSDGRVWSHRTKRYLKPRLTSKGYHRVSLSKNNQVKDAYIHRLVVQAFLDNPEQLPEVNHIDADKSNNSVDNLEWVSRLGNNHHAASLGLQYRGNSICKVYSTEFVELTKKFIKTHNLLQAYAAKQLGVPKTTINGWMTGRKRVAE